MRIRRADLSKKTLDQVMATSVEHWIYLTVPRNSKYWKRIWAIIWAHRLACMNEIHRLIHPEER
jgi:hypothetical protein